MRRFVTAAAAFALASGAVIAAPAMADHHENAGARMMAALAMDNRAEDSVRDEWRHPGETLGFFRVEPGMTVVDYMPASGWYTRVLVPYLGAEGRYIGLTPDPASARGEQFSNYFAGLPANWAENSPGWSLTGAPTQLVASQDIGEDMAGTVDRVMIFREMHNLLRSGALRPELIRIRSLLKDDGMLGIVQHRAKPWASGDYTDGNKGYLRQSDVIGMVEAQGYQLVATSEVNANPRDPANWEGGVWTLPPGNRGDNSDAAAVGESDRMTLLFRKR